MNPNKLVSPRKLAFFSALVPGLLLFWNLGAPAQASESGADLLSYVKGQLDAAYKGTYRSPPTAAPKPTPGKNVWIISPSQANESSAIPVAAAKEAGEAIGWKMTVFDGKADASTFATGIRQAVAAKADGIILDAIDCGWIRQALVEARQANVKTIAFYALDCNDPAVKGPPLYDGIVNFGPAFPTYATGTRAWSAVKADWVISETQAKAKVIEIKQDEFLVVKYIKEGFDDELAKCKTCEIVKTIDTTFADRGPRLTQKVQEALLQFPDANALHVPYDGMMMDGVAAALMRSGKKDGILVIGGEGFPTNLKLIREKKGQDAANVYPSQWTGWAAVDSLNSVFNGQAPQDSGIGWQLIDRAHGLPPDGKEYLPPSDFKAAYKRAWASAR